MLNLGCITKSNKLLYAMVMNYLFSEIKFLLINIRYFCIRSHIMALFDRTGTVKLLKRRLSHSFVFVYIWATIN